MYIIKINNVQKGGLHSKHKFYPLTCISSSFLTLWSHVVHLNISLQQQKRWRTQMQKLSLQTILLCNLSFSGATFYLPKISFPHTWLWYFNRQMYTHTLTKWSMRRKIFYEKGFSWVRKFWWENYFIATKTQTGDEKKICVKCQHLLLTHLQHGAYFIAGECWNWERKKRNNDEKKINIHNFCGLYCVTLLQTWTSSCFFLKRGSQKRIFTWNLLSL